MSFAYAEDKIGFKNSTDLISYIFLVNLMNLNSNLNSKLLVGVNE